MSLYQPGSCTAGTGHVPAGPRPITCRMYVARGRRRRLRWRSQEGRWNDCLVRKQKAVVAIQRRVVLLYLRGGSCRWPPNWAASRWLPIWIAWRRVPNWVASRCVLSRIPCRVLPGWTACNHLPNWIPCVYNLESLLKTDSDTLRRMEPTPGSFSNEGVSEDQQTELEEATYTTGLVYPFGNATQFVLCAMHSLLLMVGH